jgi:hypothetical protein
MPGQKPKLVDYDLIQFPQKQIANIRKQIVKQDNSKLYINLLMIIILCIGGYILYHRMKNKINMIQENNANIMFLNEYINYSLNNSENNNIE